MLDGLGSVTASKSCFVGVDCTAVIHHSVLCFSNPVEDVRLSAGTQQEVVE
jgi:hypothetical protein